jgi:hypothetical protein
MRRFIFSLTAVLIFTLSASHAAETPKGFNRVAKDKLDGQRLILKEAGCSLAAPTPEWVWVAPENTNERSYMCLSTKSGAGITVSVGELTNGMDEHAREELTTGCKKNAAQNGAAVSNEKFEESEIPLAKNSWRYSFTVSAGPRKVVAIFYFIKTVGKSFVTIQGTSLDGSDTPTFRAFVSSLKLLAAAPAPAPAK